MIPEINNSLHGLNKLETAENRISELVNKLSENTQSNVQKRKKKGKMKQSTRNTYEVVKWLNIHITEIRRRQGETEWGRSSV